MTPQSWLMVWFMALVLHGFTTLDLPSGVIKHDWCPIYVNGHLNIKSSMGPIE